MHAPFFYTRPHILTIHLSHPIYLLINYFSIFLKTNLAK
jgi:hypothetical protein